jgi:hypothetical protein
VLVCICAAVLVYLTLACDVLPGLHCCDGLGLEICDEDEEAGEKSPKQVTPFDIRRPLSIGEDGRIKGGRGEN